MHIEAGSKHESIQILAVLRFFFKGDSCFAILFAHQDPFNGEMGVGAPNALGSLGDGANSWQPLPRSNGGCAVGVAVVQVTYPEPTHQDARLKHQFLWQRNHRIQSREPDVLCVVPSQGLPRISRGLSVARQKTSEQTLR